MEFDVEKVMTNDCCQVPEGYVQISLEYVERLQRTELANLTSELLEVKETTRGCPCELVKPCIENCSCARPYMSAGCQRCARYGSLSQRTEAAKYLAKQSWKLDLFERYFWVLSESVERFQKANADREAYISDTKLSKEEGDAISDEYYDAKEDLIDAAQVMVNGIERTSYEPPSS